MRATRSLFRFFGIDISYRSCTAQGDLQDPNMFLLEIVDIEVPGDDTFTRVINVTDLDSDIGYSVLRATAIAEGKVYYRSIDL